MDVSKYPVSSTEDIKKNDPQKKKKKIVSFLLIAVVQFSYKHLHQDDDNMWTKFILSSSVSIGPVPNTAGCACFFSTNLKFAKIVCVSDNDVFFASLFSPVLQALEVLPVAPPAPPRQLTEKEVQRLEEQEEDTLRELRLFLRDVTNRLSQDKRFKAFTKPVDLEEVRLYSIVFYSIKINI